VQYFILEQLFFVSIGIMVYMVVRKLPQVRGFEDRPTDERGLAKKFFLKTGNNWANKLDQKLINVVEKVLRKMKVLLMRMDNYVSHHLKKVVSKEGIDEHSLSAGIFDDISEKGVDSKNNEVSSEVVGDDEEGEVR